MLDLGAVVVGIGAYRGSAESAAALKLQFPSKDADAIELYLRLCWPDSSKASTIRIPETDATAAAIERACATLASRGPFELLIFYLSGHGVSTADGGRFLVQPATSSDPANLLTSGALDRILESIPAKRVVLILDCCFAESIVGSMAFFSQLRGAEGRLFIASSRADQVTWEADEAGHSIFTGLLLDFLGSDVEGARGARHSRGYVDVDAELFPFLCEQVPLCVLQRKQASQEPVKGGV